MPMLTLEEATDRLLARVSPPPETDEVALLDAAGRVLADPRVVSSVDVPPFDNSAMDGFALRAADTPGRLRVVGESLAGLAAVPAVSPGTAVAIATGAPMPAGADSIAPIEDVESRDGAVVVPAAVEMGRHVRRAGHDTAAGTTFELRGALGPASLAVLASMGIGRVRVRRLPRVAIVSTGDELVEAGAPLAPGQIHDSNSVALAAAVREAGGVPSVLPRQRDDESLTEATLAAAAASADLVVTSGGVSVGPRDYVRAVLERRGGLDFWRVAIQPGKPLAVGEIDGTTVIGLPGNPVSALVTFELFVRPFVRAMLGLEGDGRLRLRAEATTRMAKSSGRRAFLRVVVGDAGDGTYRADPAGGQQSSQLRPMADANALLVVPEQAEAAEAGANYEAIMLGPVRGVGTP